MIPENEAAVYPALNTIFCSVLGRTGIQLAPATTAADVTGWDSLSHMLLIVEIERHFRIRFTSSEVSRLKNVGELVRLIVGKARR